MPYKIRKQKCRQSSGKKGTYTVSFTDKKGKKRRMCAKSRKSAQGIIVNIERGPNESIDLLADIILENVINRLIEE